MKKIAISAVLLALVGIAQAQVTVNGLLGYQVSKSGTTTTYGFHDSIVGFTAKEDLGGGTSITANMGLNGVGGRGSAVTTEDATLVLDGAFGSVKVGEVETGNGIIGRGYAGGAFIGSDGSVLAGASNKQYAGYTTPAFGGFKLNINSTRAIAGTGDAAVAAGVSYDQGPVSAGYDYKETTKRQRLSASYNLGFTKVGAGYSFHETDVANSRVLSVTAPIGTAFGVGASIADGNGKATEFAATYALSKRTGFAVAYQDVKDNTDAAKNVGTTRIRLTHSF